jgi:hypothetical protein
VDQTLTHGVQAAKVWPSLGYDDLNLLGELSALMMVQVIRPLGELLTGLPVGRHAPEKTAGPSFMLTSATPVTPTSRQPGSSFANGCWSWARRVTA